MKADTLNESDTRIQESKTPETPPMRRDRLSLFMREVIWRAHWLLPNLVPLPDRRETSHFEKRDRKLNEMSRVPEDEELRLRVVWGMELFGPAEVEGLCDRLRQLNWSAGSGRAPGEVVDWVRQQRAYGGAGAWYNVGLVTERKDSKRFFMVNNYAAMPKGIDYLLVRIYQLTSSLTGVLIGFVFKEGVEQVYQSELNEDRITIRKRNKRRWSVSIIDPKQLKMRSIENSRSKARAIAQKWFSNNLPGIFCSLSSERMPTAELVTTRNNNLFPERGTHYDWRNLISNMWSYDVWTCSECVGLRFAINGIGWREETPHLIVAMCTSEVSEETIKDWGMHERGAYVEYCHEQMGGILINYAAVEFLRETSKDLKISRAALAIGSAGRRKAVHTLEKIQAFFDRSLGTPAIVTELLDRSKNVHYYTHECERFFSIGLRETDPRREFGIVLRGQTQFLAEKVISEERSMREHFEQLSTVISVRESVRAQKRMEWLTFFALVVAAASLFATLFPIKDWPETTKDLLNGLSNFFQITSSAD